jgi:hypothetical protein
MDIASLYISGNAPDAEHGCDLAAGGAPPSLISV